MRNFTLKKSNNCKYAVYENGIKVKNAIFTSEDDFRREMRALDFTMPFMVYVEN